MMSLIIITLRTIISESNCVLSEGLLTMTASVCFLHGEQAGGVETWGKQGVDVSTAISNSLLITHGAGAAFFAFPSQYPYQMSVTSSFILSSSPGVALQSAAIGAKEQMPISIKDTVIGSCDEACVGTLLK